jgi:hypothetical protein
MDVVYVRFDKSLDYMSVVNSFPIKKFLESAYGEFPHMVSPKAYLFDREQLGQFIQEQFNLSKEYVIDSRKVPSAIIEEYYNELEKSGPSLYLVEFEPETLLDDHIVTINKEDKVLGVFATADDFDHITTSLQEVL